MEEITPAIKFGAADVNATNRPSALIEGETLDPAADSPAAPAGSDNETLKALALASERLHEFTEGKAIKNVIVVPGRLVNIVVG